MLERNNGYEKGMRNKNLNESIFLITNAILSKYYFNSR